MNSIECEHCIKRQTMYCPNSSECFETKDKPQWQNRIMLLEENAKLKQLLENAQSVSVADHRYASDKEDEVIVLKSVLKEIREYIMEHTYWTNIEEEEGYLEKVVPKEMLEIIDKGIGG